MAVSQRNKQTVMQQKNTAVKLLKLTFKYFPVKMKIIGMESYFYF